MSMQFNKSIRFTKAIVSKQTGEVVFAVPDSIDEKEKQEYLQEQIVARLLIFTDAVGSISLKQKIDNAIKQVEHYLRELITHYPEEASMIRIIAEQAGQKYLKMMDDVRYRQNTMIEKVRKGEMFLGIGKINGGDCNMVTL